MSTDLQRQFDTATAFFLAGERCSQIVSFGRYGLHSVGAPTITNYALSVEIALKLIHLILSGASHRGHDLQVLFEELPEGNKGNLPHLGAYASDIARNFEEWRYPYEKDFLIGDEETVRRAFIECYHEIRRLRPDLLSVYEKLWGSFDPDWFNAEVRSIEVRALTS